MTEQSDVDQSGADQPVRRGRGRPRDPSTDGRIIAAAAELLLQQGFDRTTVDDVAARAKVGKATVYRRWPSKEDLAVAAMGSLLAAEFPEPDTGSIVSDLLESYRNALQFVNSEGGQAFIRVTIAESIRDPRIAALYLESVRTREDQSRESFRRAVERGEVRPDADLDAAIQWFGGLVVSRAVMGRPMPPVDAAESMVDFTLRGIATEKVQPLTG